MDLSFLGPAASSVVVVIAFLKYLKDESDKREIREKQFMEVIDANTKVTKENHDFLKNLNGELRKAAERKLSNGR